MLSNENIELSNTKGLFETTDDSISLLNLRELDDFEKAEVDLENMKKVDWLAIYNKQPTQINNLNNKLLKTNKDMENTMVIDDFQANPVDAEKIDSEIQMLNRKRKQSDSLFELRTELLAQYKLYILFLF